MSVLRSWDIESQTSSGSKSQRPCVCAQVEEKGVARKTKKEFSAAEREGGGMREEGNEEERSKGLRQSF